MWDSRPLAQVRWRNGIISGVTRDPRIKTLTDRQREDVERYVKTGETDLLYSAWPGDIFRRGRIASEVMREALVDEVHRRARAAADRRSHPPLNDLVGLTRRRVEPMVRGLFPRKEQDPVLQVLERSVVVLTAENIASVLRETTWMHTAWDLANLYLTSSGADLLSADAPRLVGLSEETSCYLSVDYFWEQDRFEDFLVHEAAHIFHNCKRHTMGFPETSRREWPLDIAYDKRETFAYSCEAFSRVLELGSSRQARLAMVRQLADGHVPGTDHMDEQEYVSILTEAAGARNGWKHILSRCAPPRHRRVPS